MSRNIRLVVEYDGTDFCGWQRQKNGPTVQQHIEEAVSTILGSPTQVQGASRTDAGVHALGQVCNFDCKIDSIPCCGLQKAINGLLPTSIAIAGVDEVDADFHARFSATGKRYRYGLDLSPQRSPLKQRYRWHLPFPLDLDAMRHGAEALIGEHDFSAFRASGCTAKTPTRNVESIEISRLDHTLDIEVIGNAFLRNMVRIIVGTLVDVGRGAMSPSAVGNALRSCDRAATGRTAPACGLTLVEVFVGRRRYHGGNDR